MGCVLYIQNKKDVSSINSLQSNAFFYISLTTILSFLWSFWNNPGAELEKVLLSVSLEVRSVSVGTVSDACIISSERLSPAWQLSLQLLIGHVYCCRQPAVVWGGRGVTWDPHVGQGSVCGGALQAGHSCQLDDAFSPRGLWRDQRTVLGAEPTLAGVI